LPEGVYQWTAGLGRHKEILIPTDHYDVLALVALGPDVIQFVHAKDVNKKTYRTKPENLYAELAGDTWRAITNALSKSMPNMCDRPASDMGSRPWPVREMRN